MAMGWSKKILIKEYNFYYKKEVVVPSLVIFLQNSFCNVYYTARNIYLEHSSEGV